MKKKLFVIATLISIYALFSLGFTTLDNQGHITKVLEDVKLSSAKSTIGDIELPDTSLRRPCPKPRKPTSPPPSVI